MDLVDKQIGPELHLKISEDKGALTLRFEHHGASGVEAFEVTEDLKYFIDKEKDKLPAWLLPIVNMGEAALP